MLNQWQEAARGIAGRVRASVVRGRFRVGGRVEGGAPDPEAFLTVGLGSGFAVGLSQLILFQGPDCLQGSG